MANIFPAEWAPQQWLWLGFPHDQSEWPDDFAGAQAEIAQCAKAIAQNGQDVRLLCRNAENQARALALLGDDKPDNLTLPLYKYGDIWLRDTGPLVTCGDNGAFQAQIFGFNGWGGKYLMPGDEDIGALLAKDCDLPAVTHQMILEGGAIDCDGAGLAVTTEQCLLNPNRNPALTRDDIARHLHDALGIEHILWLGDGLVNDHTDGHVDNLARFVGQGRLALPVARGDDDPNADIFADAWARARNFAKNHGGFEIVPMPSVGRFVTDGAVQPASHMNFIIANHAVIVPLYGAGTDQAACDALAEYFPKRTIIGIKANAILTGGGSFHCASQQMPA